jgi:predicted TPR repeat methyltransferase
VLTDKADIDGAIRAYQLAITRNPRYTLAYAALGDAYVVLGKSQEAEVMLSKALALDKNCSLAWNGKGKNAERAGRYQEALAHFLQAVTTDVQFAEAKFNAGRIYANLGQIAEAQQCFDDALTLEPSNEKFRHMASMFTRADSTDQVAESRMPDAYVREIFDQFAPTFDQSLVEGLQYQTPNLIFQLISPWLETPSRTLNRSHNQFDAIDLGCGTGLMGPFISKYAQTLVGVDISSKMLEKADKRGYTKLVASEIGAYLQTQENTCADIVLAVDVFVYFGNLTATFSEVKRVLRQGGMFAFSVESLGDTQENAALPFQLKATGRYQHNHEYIQALSTQFGFLMDAHKSCTIRMEAGKAVAGEIYSLISN